MATETMFCHSGVEHKEYAFHPFGMSSIRLHIETNHRSQKHVQTKLNMVFSLAQKKVQYIIPKVKYWCVVVPLVDEHSNLAPNCLNPIQWKHFGRINICAQLTSIWQMTTWYSFVYISARSHFLCCSWLAFVIIYCVWLVNRAKYSTSKICE